MERFRSSDVVRRSLGDGRDFVSTADGASVAFLPAPIVDALIQCHTFAPLPDHASRIIEGMSWPQRLRLANVAGRYCLERKLESPLGPVSLLTTVLEDLQRSHWLTPHAAVIEALRQAPVEPVRMDTIAFVTRKRPESLERAVRSYAGNAQHFGRTIDLVVADDATEEADRETSRSVLQGIARSHSHRVRYAGREQKRRYADELVRLGCDPEVVTFALFDPEGAGVTTGANRNALLLDCVGQAFLCADDDTVCRLAPSPALRPGIRIEQKIEHDWWFFQSREEALGQVPEASVDLLALHEAALGPVAHAVTRHADLEIDLDHLGFGMLDDLTTRACRIRVTSTGWLGNSGAEKIGLQYLQGQNRDRLLGSPAVYRAALADHDVCRVVPQVTLTRTPFCMSTFLGLDNREPLPPFMPVCRVQDAVFGDLLRASDPEMLFGHLPWTVLHAPSLERAGHAPELARSAVLVSDVIDLLIAHWDREVLVRNPARRLAMLGAYLESVGAERMEDFERAVRALHRTRLGERLSSLERTLREGAEMPPYWKEDMRTRIAALERGLTDPHAIVPANWSSAKTVDEARVLGHRLVGQLGRLLRHWADLVEAAKILAGQGLRVSEAV